MARAAIFVEGQTELEFVRLLVTEMAGQGRVLVHEERRHAGRYLALTVKRTSSVKTEILLVDCCGDGAVLSAIRERYTGLTAAGYSLILGLRDLFPKKLSDLPNVLAAMTKSLPAGPCRVHVTVAVTEVEAWFIQDDLHFLNIDNRLTQDVILRRTGYDVSNDRAELIENPAKSLRQMYQIVGKTYKKSKKCVARTVSALDIMNMYITRRHIMSSFDDFVSEIEKFLSV